MKKFPIYAVLVAMVAISGCVSHTKETVVERQPATIIERQPADHTVVVVPPQQ